MSLEKAEEFLKAAQRCFVHYLSEGTHLNLVETSVTEQHWSVRK